MFALDVPHLAQTSLFVGLNRRKHAHDARHAFLTAICTKLAERLLVFKVDAKPLTLNIEFNAPNHSVLFFA